MTKFHDYITEHLFKGSLPDWQKEPVDKLVASGIRRGRSLEDCAYVLATAYWESGRFRYDEEIDKGGSRPYAEAVLVWNNKRTAFYGRGYVQLTWLGNYANMSALLSAEFGKPIDLVNKPDLAIEYSEEIIWEGMIRGSFTGKSLADYITSSSVDYVNARRIVNGTDHAQEIADIAKEFETALKLQGDEPLEVSKCPLNQSGCPLSKVKA